METMTWVQVVCLLIMNGVLMRKMWKLPKKIGVPILITYILLLVSAVILIYYYPDTVKGWLDRLQ